MCNTIRFFVASTIGVCVSFAQIYTVSTVAGTNRLLDGGAASAAPLRSPLGVAVDAVGYVYIADTDDNRIRRVNQQGIISTYCGTGNPGFAGDRGKANAATLNGPTGLAVDSQGNLYIADRDNYRVRRITTDGVINTVAGNGSPGSSGDGGNATSAQLQPIAVAVDNKGNLYISDILNSKIRKVDASGTITTVAGTGLPGYSGDNGLAINAQISFVTGLATDSNGNLYLADFYSYRVRKVDTKGMMTTFAGAGTFGTISDGAPASTALLVPNGVAVDNASTNLYVSDVNRNVVRRVNLSTNTISTVAGNGGMGFGGDGFAAISGQLNYPAGLALDSMNNLFITDFANARIREVSGGQITTLAGTSMRDGSAATNAFLNFPQGIAVDAANHVVVADYDNMEARRFSPGGIISEIGQLNGLPLAVAVDSSGNFLISDDKPEVVKVSPSGATTVVTVNTTGQQITKISNPTGLASDLTGNVYVADDNNAGITRISPSGVATLIAGNGSFLYSGDNGPALSAGMDPFDITVDTKSNLYVCDQVNNRIRKITPDGNITTVAGTGVSGYSGDGGPATAAQLFLPSGIAVDAAGNLYIADFGNYVVRRVNAGGLITTIAGNGTNTPATGDGGPATAAQMSPLRLAVDPAGNIYVSDSSNDRVRLLTPKTVTPAAISIFSGNNLTGIVGTTLGPKLIVKVTDSAGAPIPGVTVTYTVAPAGAATLSPSPAITLLDGTASASVTLGTLTGPVTITATALGGPSVAFKVTVNPAVSPTAPLVSPGGIVSAGLSMPVITTLASNGIASIFGQNFAPDGTAKQVGQEDLVNGKVPTLLAGACVQFGDQRAPIFAVYPGQLNIQVPTLPVGNVSVQVINKCGTSAQEFSPPMTVTIQPACPEFFYFTHNTNGKNPIAAINALTGVYIGAPGLLSGATFTPAAPGDILTLFGTGFGATDPAFGPGELPGVAAQVTAQVTVTIGGIQLDPSEVLYTGLSQNAGLYQLNLRVPQAMPSGDQPVVITIGGAASPSTAFITVAGR